MKTIYPKIAEIAQVTTGLALATVTGTKGSTPQKPGSSALFSGDKLIAGTVGGGIVENRIQQYAAGCMLNGKSAYLHYSLDKEADAINEAVCGGVISILVDADPIRSLHVFLEMQRSLSAGKPGILVTKMIVEDDPYVTIQRFWTTGDEHIPLPVSNREIVEREVRSLLALEGKAAYRELDLPSPEGEKDVIFFLEPVLPLPQLIIAGAGHIGKALSHMGKLLDFEVTVIDDREEYANPDNLPDADHIIVRDIGEAVKAIPKNRNTYVTIVTRGHNHDADALKPCIGSDAAYVGMMGSKGKVAKMYGEFIKNGWATEEEWQRICTPIGLEIGSKTVEEIAVSIAAQLVIYRQLAVGSSG